MTDLGYTEDDGNGGQVPNSSFVYAYQNENWVTFNNPSTASIGTRGFYGLWGSSDPTTGNLSSIGFIERDVVCQRDFVTSAGGANIDWLTPRSGEERTRPTLPSDY